MHQPTPVDQHTCKTLQKNAKALTLAGSRALQESDIAHHLWVEQPENCIATKPYHKTEVHKFFRRFKLFS